MESLHIQKKGKLLSRLERIYIYNLILQKQQINDTFIDTNNPIFDIILKYGPHNNTNFIIPHFSPSIFNLHYTP
jgi:hypothetical protein